MKNEKKRTKIIQLSILFIYVFCVRVSQCVCAFSLDSHQENKRENKHKSTERNNPEANNNRRQQIAVRLCRLWLIVTVEFSARTSIVFCVYIYLFVIVSGSDFFYSCTLSLYSLISFDLFLMFFLSSFASVICSHTLVNIRSWLRQHTHTLTEHSIAEPSRAKKCLCIESECNRTLA